MANSKSFHTLVKQNKIEIIKASDPAKNLIDKIFKTSAEWIDKDYKNPVLVFQDKDFIYKVFYHDIKINGITLKNQKHTIDMYIKFFKNYKGDMQLQNYYIDTQYSILQLVKLPGETLTNLKGDVDLTIHQAGEWFAEQCKQIHLAGIDCVKKYKEFQIERHIFNNGYYFIFSDWNPDNILYDQTTNKLYLVDLQPVNWIPNDLWKCTIRSQWRDIARLNWKIPKRQITKQHLLNIEYNTINLIKESLGEQYRSRKSR